MARMLSCRRGCRIAFVMRLYSIYNKEKIDNIHKHLNPIIINIGSENKDDIFLDSDDEDQ